VAIDKALSSALGYGTPYQPRRHQPFRSAAARVDARSHVVDSDAGLFGFDHSRPNCLRSSSFALLLSQIAGAFSQLEKARLVAKLKAAREAQNKLGGRKSYAEAAPETVALAQQLHAEGLFYRKISDRIRKLEDAQL
jgi:hypothetical protein